MNTETFFQQFELLADAPNGIKKLRELILQLAVQGKLVPQNPDDEPAAVLLERIKAEKERLVKEGKIKKEKQLSKLNNNDTLYPVPDNWIWTRLGEVVNYTGAEKISPNTIPDDAWLLDLEDIEKDTSKIISRKLFKTKQSKSTKAKLNKGDVLYGKLRPYLNKVIVADDNGFCTTEIIPLKIYQSINSEYVKCVLKSPNFLQYVNSKTYGINLPRLGTEDARQAIFPLPPLAEQKRIVKKVDRLMELCDKLETQQRQKQTKTLQLGTVATSRLTTAKTPEAFKQHWHNISNSFDLIYSTPENIQQLRQTILQLAVMGKLVPQNPDDETASVLLAKIKAEKEKLIKEGKIKKSKKLNAIASDEIPYDLPKNWEWVRMQNIFTVITDGDHQAPPKVDSGVPFLVIGNIRDGFLNFDSTRYVPQKYYQSIGETRTQKKEDILYTVVGSYGIPIIVDTDQNFCVQRHIAILKSSQYLDVHYLKYVLQSELVFTQATNYATGIAQKTVPLNGLRKIHVPLPPLAQQHRILAKVNQLMSYCDELEAKLTQSLSDKEKLMDTAVYQLLTA